MLGYIVDDDNMLQYISDSEESYILKTANLIEIPADFEKEAVDMVCGQYLMIQKNSGKDIGIDIDSAVSSISEGDVSISLALGKGTLTPEQRFDKLIEYLMRGKAELTDYRRLRW